jgi:signal transduction histidine kinase/ActR/RegA family two-component response regulator
MDLNTLSGLLSFTGILVQCAVAFLTVCFFALLGRYAARRTYFTAWASAWAVLLIAVLALVVRYNVLPAFDQGTLQDPPDFAVRALFFFYQFGKLLYAALLVHGTLLYLEDPRAGRMLLVAIPTLAVIAAVTVTLSDFLTPIVAWQAAFLAPAFGYVSWRLLRLKGDRQTLGTRLVGGVFGLMAVLWLLYFLAFTGVVTVGPGARDPFSLFAINNSFIDTLVAMLLAMGMVVLLMEDATRQMEQLRAQRQAELADAHRMETVGRLVSGIAHELNNPLAAVLNFSEILLHEPRVEHDRLALSTIREQARRCRNIVRNLLTFVREGRIQRQPVVLPEVVARVVSAFEPELVQFGITCRVEFPGDLPVLEGDIEGLEQVFTNLISNAVHAIGRFGDIRIAALDAGEWVTVLVEDNGPGIPSAVIGRIFEPFFSGSTVGRTGLGLSVTQGIVRLHGGTITAENRVAPERGVRLSFTLPVHPRESLGHPLPSQARAPVEERGKRVLLIEDETSIRSALRRYFEKGGWRVDEAGAAMAGLDLLLRAEAGEAAYHLVISDLQMPDMSGILLHDRLKRDHPGLLERFIFITGDVASPEAAAFVAATARPVLEKPFELRALSEVIARVLRRETEA